MSRQINFYMDDKTQNYFMSIIKENKFVFLSEKGGIIDNIDDYFEFYLYKNEFGNISFKENDEIMDILNSPIIEVKKTRIKGKKILRGRLWISDKFYKNNIGDLEYSKKYIDDYQVLYKWVKKSVPYQEVMMGGYFIKEYANDRFVDIEKQGYIFTS